jgi:hypothetical protein
MTGAGLADGDEGPGDDKEDLGDEGSDSGTAGGDELAESSAPGFLWAVSLLI